MQILLVSPAGAQSLSVLADRPLVPAGSGPAAGRDTAPTIERGNGQALIVWRTSIHDYRGDIVGQLVDDDGTVVAIDLAHGPTFQGEPAIAFDGERYLVVYSEGSIAQDERWVRGRFVSADGVVGAPFDVVDDPRLRYGLDVAHAAGSYLVTFGRIDAENNQVDAVVVDALGNITPAPRVATMSAYARIGTDGAGFLVAWEDFAHGTIGYRRLDLGGDPVDLPRWPRLDGGVPVSDRRPAVAFAADHYVIGFAGQTFDGEAWSAQTVFAQRVSIDGSALGPATVVGSGDYIPAVELAAAAHQVAVVWRADLYTGAHAYGARLSSGGHVVGPGAVLLADEPWVEEVAVGARADELTLYYTAPDRPEIALDTDVWARTLGPALVPQPRRLVSELIGSHNGPQWRGGGEGSMVVWQDLRRTPPQVYGARLDDAGASLDGEGVLLAPAAVRQDGPQLARSTGSFLTVWASRQSVSGSFHYGAAGALLLASPSGLAVQPIELVELGLVHVSSPVLASRADGYLVAWIDRRDGAPRIYGTAVSPLGVPAVPGGQLLIDDPTVPGSSLSLATTATGYALAYRSSVAGTPDVYVRELAADGLPLGDEALRVAISEHHGVVGITTGAGRTLVTWSDGTDMSLAELGGTPLVVTASRSLPDVHTRHAIVPLADGSTVIAWVEEPTTPGVLADLRALGMCADGALGAPATLAPSQTTLMGPFQAAWVGAIAISPETANVLYVSGSFGEPGLSRVIALKVGGCAAPADPADGGSCDGGPYGDSGIEVGGSAGANPAADRRTTGCGCQSRGTGSGIVLPLLLAALAISSRRPGPRPPSSGPRPGRSASGPGSCTWRCCRW